VDSVSRIRAADAGVTLLEMMVVVAIIGILAATAGPNVRRWREDARLKASARNVADAFTIARGEALRTGERHIVFFGEDIAGNPLANDVGQMLVSVVLDDDADCDIDAGEARRDFPLEDGVGLGVVNASAPHDLDSGSTGNLSGGNTFVQPAAGSPEALWVAFGADGIPVGLTDTCVIGTTGTGGGSIYLENGRRDYAIVLTPLGAVRVSGWEAEAGAWN
jgi:prepilin-type N-terminal cleavage/methylation domain-containing protein